MLLIQCDFDDTITVGNVSSSIRTKFAPKKWLEMEKEYYAGLYSVEESNIRQYAMFQIGRKEIEEHVRKHVTIRKGFANFIEHCQRIGVRVTVVSSGLDIYIRPTMRRLGLEQMEVYSGKAQVSPSGIHVKYTDPSGKPLSSGFKEAYLSHFKESGYTVIYIGDGLSDIVPATKSDFTIARSQLKRHFETNNLPHYPYYTFTEVTEHLQKIQCQLEG